MRRREADSDRGWLVHSCRARRRCGRPVCPRRSRGGVSLEECLLVFLLVALGGVLAAVFPSLRLAAQNMTCSVMQLTNADARCSVTSKAEQTNGGGDSLIPFDDLASLSNVITRNANDATGGQATSFAKTIFSRLSNDPEQSFFASAERQFDVAAAQEGLVASDALEQATPRMPSPRRESAPPRPTPPRGAIERHLSEEASVALWHIDPQQLFIRMAGAMYPLDPNETNPVDGFVLELAEERGAVRAIPTTERAAQTILEWNARCEVDRDAPECAADPVFGVRPLVDDEGRVVLDHWAFAYLERDLKVDPRRSIPYVDEEGVVRFLDYREPIFRGHQRSRENWGYRAWLGESISILPEHEQEQHALIDELEKLLSDKSPGDAEWDRAHEVFRLLGFTTEEATGVDGGKAIALTGIPECNVDPSPIVFCRLSRALADRDPQASPLIVDPALDSKGKHINYYLTAFDRYQMLSNNYREPDFERDDTYVDTARIVGALRDFPDTVIHEELHRKYWLSVVRHYPGIRHNYPGIVFAPTATYADEGDYSIEETAAFLTQLRLTEEVLREAVRSLLTTGEMSPAGVEAWSSPWSRQIGYARRVNKEARFAYTHALHILRHGRMEGREAMEVTRENRDFPWLIVEEEAPGLEGGAKLLLGARRFRVKIPDVYSESFFDEVSRKAQRHGTILNKHTWLFDVPYNVYDTGRLDRIDTSSSTDVAWLKARAIETVERALEQLDRDHVELERLEEALHHDQKLIDEISFGFRVIDLDDE